MKHLLSTQNLASEYVSDIFRQAEEFKKNQYEEKTLLKNKLIALLFYENSTRTRASFEIAAKRLGAETINLDVSTSSVAKGETIEDTARTLINLGADLVIMRHSASGASLGLSKALSNTKVKVINAGDGMNEHPTQALLDLFSIFEACGEIKGKTIVIVGDCLHSRVARSNIYLLKSFGAKIRLVGPPTLLPKDFEYLGVSVFYDLEKALNCPELAFIVVLRLQKERQTKGLIASLAEYSRSYGITEKRLMNAGLNLHKVKILHPGPVNRGVEIDSELVDNEDISLIHKQVVNGLYVRMSILAKLLTEDFQ